MGTKNNPKNRGDTGKKKIFDGKEIEPVVFYDTERKLKYLAAKVAKTNDVICGSSGEPLRWANIAD